MANEIDPEELHRREQPHHATVTIKIDVRKINQNGTLDPLVMGNGPLARYGITRKAQIYISGSTEADCIKILKERLERLNG